MDRPSWRQKRAIECVSCGAKPYRKLWRCLRREARGIRLQGLWYCGGDCLEPAVAAILQRENFLPARCPVTTHRVPLGLLLLSRQQLTVEQLRAALELQRDAGTGKIGEWLQHLGFVREEQVTGALARQWSCPVLRANLCSWDANHFPEIPTSLLQASQMIPAEFVASSRTLLIAFSDAVDHSSMYAIEQMLGYRTEACFARPSVVRQRLQALAQVRRSGEVLFDRTENVAECARIVSSYSSRLGTEEIRLICCGAHIWVRLDAARGKAVNLILRSPHNSPSKPGQSSLFGPTSLPWPMGSAL